MLPTSAGVEPVTSWSSVGRRIQLSKAEILNVKQHRSWWDGSLKVSSGSTLFANAYFYTLWQWRSLYYIHSNKVQSSNIMIYSVTQWLMWGYSVSSKLFHDIRTLYKLLATLLNFILTNSAHKRHKSDWVTSVFRSDITTISFIQEYKELYWSLCPTCVLKWENKKQKSEYLSSFFSSVR